MLLEEIRCFSIQNINGTAGAEVDVETSKETPDPIRVAEPRFLEMGEEPRQELQVALRFVCLVAVVNEAETHFRRV